MPDLGAMGKETRMWDSRQDNRPRWSPRDWGDEEWDAERL